MSRQPENCENRNDPDLVQAFLKKWWVESDFKAPNLPLSLRSISVKFMLRTRLQTMNHVSKIWRLARSVMDILIAARKRS